MVHTHGKHMYRDMHSETHDMDTHAYRNTWVCAHVYIGNNKSKYVCIHKQIAQNTSWTENRVGTFKKKDLSKLWLVVGGTEINSQWIDGERETGSDQPSHYLGSE